MNACKPATSVASKRKIAMPGGQREPREDLEAEQDREAAGHELDEHVAGEDVREQPDGERDQPQEVRERSRAGRS